MNRRRIALLAIGGNALLKEKESGLQEEQLENARETAEMLARVVAEGYALCVVHGNGPQVGNLIIQQEAGSGQIPPYSLDICGAMTQGSMGYMLERMLINRLRFLKINTPVTSVLTEVVVDKEDKGFQDPTKPVGPFYPEFRALELMRSKRWKMKEDSGRGWRKVVPSPRPLEIIQLDAIKTLLHAGHSVIAGGGGGIPVIRDASGFLVGVEAVIDKDRLSAAEARKHLAAGQFPAGSMGPKIESALAYLDGGGHEVLITTAEALAAGDPATVGTRVVRD